MRRLSSPSVGKRLNDLLADMATMAEGPSATLDPNRVSSTGNYSLAPKGYGRTLVEEWEDRFTRLVELAELDLAKHRKQEGFGKVRDREEKSARIVSVLYRGRPASFVAHAEDESEVVVRKLRQKAGLEATTGRRR